MLNDNSWVDGLLDLVSQKVDALSRNKPGFIPYMANDGHYSDKQDDIIWWTNGFWGGMLWQLWQYSGKTSYKEHAEKLERQLDAAFDRYQGLHHDVGFMWLHTAVANYRLTGNERSLQRGLHAAHLLAGRYNPQGKFIRSWNRDRAGWVIIDSMLNIPLLYWAGEVLGDPRFIYIAKDHADTVMNNIIRADGSSAHIGVFDPTNGILLETPGGQGYASGSSWSRGQAWALYGFALSYRHSGEKRYLDVAKQVAHYFIAQVAATDFVPLCDFRAPAQPVILDTSAGLCAACGLLEIAEHVPEVEKAFYSANAVKMIKNIAEKYLISDPELDGIIDMAAAEYHTQETQGLPIIFGDYFFVEALLRIKNKSFLIW